MAAGVPVPICSHFFKKPATKQGQRRSMEDQRASPEVIYALQQLGFPRPSCVQAAVRC
jgi:hypothetical protein